MVVALFILSVSITIFFHFFTKTTVMAQTKADFTSVLASIDEETTRVGVKIDELVAQLKAGGLSADEEAEVFAGLSAAAEKLKAIGKPVVEDEIPV
jgi:hypothetical protein